MTCFRFYRCFMLQTNITAGNSIIKRNHTNKPQNILNEMIQRQKDCPFNIKATKSEPEVNSNLLFHRNLSSLRLD